MTVDEEGVLRINARAGGLDLLPGRSSSEVFAPPRERPALLWSDLVNVALFVLVQVDANAVVIPALQNIAAVVGLPSVPLEPCFDRKTGMVGQALGIVGRQVDDSTRFIAALSTVGLTGKPDPVHPPRRSHSSSPTKTVRG